MRARALAAAEAAGPEGFEHWGRGIERALKDGDGAVRLAAVRAMAAQQREEAANLMRGYLNDPNPQLAVTAACALAESTADEGPLRGV